ncbi:transcriptional regulator PpsR [Sphingomonas sp. 1P06PA]|uniref:transcriptional regulator PpsR n=1 Tax=Sphingomonas sp. 1P06PA TaxID=554121 RepID=UPI0039A4EA77
MNDHDASLQGIRPLIARFAAVAEAVSSPLPVDTLAGILAASGDIVLALSGDGVVASMAFGDVDPIDDVEEWTGHPFEHLVTVESRAKVREMLADAARGAPGRWRQVNHPTSAGVVPIRYVCLAAGSGFVAIGRDLRAQAATQQRLLQTQQSLERDYLRLRQAESRYRLLFDLSPDPVLVINASTRRILEANPAAHAALALAPGTLVRQPAGALVAADAQDALIAALGAAHATGRAVPVTLTMANGVEMQVTASAFRQNDAALLLVQLAPQAEANRATAIDDRLRTVVDRMPDAFVLTDRRLGILIANAAFVELTQSVSAERVAGRRLGDWLGRPGIDIELIVGQLREHGAARNVSTILRDEMGAQEEVEVSAVSVRDQTGDIYGFAIRGVGRRLRDLPPAERDLPRSVEQLTELVGRMSLKEIVRESTDLIERLCIEAALSYTSDNRASAAEILGLSRQSLYSKLHRHGLAARDEDRG